MHFLLTNDDGVDAPGLSALHQSVSDFIRNNAVWASAKLTVVAPDRGRSECGHSVTTGHDLELKQIREGWYSLNGTPVDCVRVALATVSTDVTAVFSGINQGANVGVDLFVSGTFAAAREATIMGHPAIAISHYRRPEITKSWDHASQWLTRPLEMWLEQLQQSQDNSTPPLWNLNLPAIDPAGPLPEIAECLVETQPMVREAQLHTVSNSNSVHRVAMTSDFHGRPRAPGSDVDQCFGGRISISKLTPHVT